MEVSRKVKKFYFGEENLSEETLPQFVNVSSKFGVPSVLLYINIHKSFQIKFSVLS